MTSAPTTVPTTTAPILADANSDLDSLSHFIVPVQPCADPDRFLIEFEWRNREASLLGRSRNLGADLEKLVANYPDGIFVLVKPVRPCVVLDLTGGDGDKDGGNDAANPILV